MRRHARHSRPEVLVGTRAVASDLVVHPVRPLLFAGSVMGDCIVRAWNLDSRSLDLALGHKSGTGDLALRPDGGRLASGLHDCTAQLWDLASGKLLRTLAGHSRAVNAVTWDASGALVATGSGDQSVRVWHAESGELRHCLEGHSDWVRALAAHPDADMDLLASGSADRTVRLWRFSSGLCLRTLVGHEGEVRSLAASAHWLISGSMDRTLRVWSWETGACARVLETAGQLFDNSLAWRGSRLATLDVVGQESLTEPATVRVWDTSPEDPRAWSCAGPLRSRANWITGVALLGDGRVVFNAAGGLAAVALETPAEARARRRRLARAD